MTELMSEIRGEDVKAELDRRFPDLRCLRCGHERFFLQLRQDRSFSAIMLSPIPNVADLICQNCGLIETHNIPNLMIRPPVPSE
jgi:transcription elongation factor Elf1